MSTIRSFGRAAGAVGCAAALVLVATPASAEDTATVSILHAVPATPVDVYANGEVLLPDFQPGTLTDPLELPAGTYDLAVFPAGEGPDGDPAIEAAGVEVPASADATVVAHLDADGEPMLSLYANDVSSVPAGKARLTVRHVAAAPAVDVLAGGAPVITNLTNPNEQILNLPAGVVSASVAAAGTTDPVIGPADVDVAEGANTIVYAWGSLDDGNLALAVQTVSGLHSTPDGVPAGVAGLAATNAPDSGAAGWVATAGMLLALTALGVAVLLRRRPAEDRH